MATQTSMSSDDIIEAIGNLSVVELAELIQKFKDKFGVTIAAPAAPAPAVGGGGAAGAAAPVEEQTEFTVILKSGGGKKNSGVQKKPGSTNPGPEEGQDPVGGGPRPGEEGRARQGTEENKKKIEA